jgi:hypothetical protein
MSKSKCIVCGEKMLARGFCRKHYDYAFRREHYLRNKDKAITYSAIQSQLNKLKLLLKLNFSGKCFKCKKLISDFYEKRACYISDDNVLCPKCWHKKRKIKQFSRYSDRCVECGITEGEHAGRGLCWRCYARDFRRRKAEEKAINSKN